MDYELEEFLEDAVTMKKLIRADEPVPKELEISLNEKLDRVLERPTRRAIRPEVGSGYQSRGKVFNSFGEQLQAIHRAAQTGEVPDKRLYSIRAATGMSEGIPSDGGSNRGPS